VYRSLKEEKEHASLQNLRRGAKRVGIHVSGTEKVVAYVSRKNKKKKKEQQNFLRYKEE